MTAIDLDELQRLHEAATPEPWSVGCDYNISSMESGRRVTSDDALSDIDDLRLIAAARNALPALLRLARRARRLEEAVRAAEGFISGAMPYYAADRKQAIERVVPLLRAALAGGDTE